MYSTVRNRKLKKVILILVGLYVMIGASLYFIQEKIMFRPTVLSQDYVYQFSKPFEEVFLKTDGDAMLNAIHFKSENPKGVSEIALYEDAQLCYDYLKEQYKESDISLYGRSLGTGIAAHLASKNDPKQLILETPYYSMVDVAQHRFPILPVKHLIKYKLPTAAFAKDANCPITIFHGTDDGVVPFESGKKLFDELPKAQAVFVQIEQGNHNNLIEFDAYRNGIENILK